MATADFDMDHASIRHANGAVDMLPLEEGDWVYNCKGPVNALVELAQGCGQNRSSGISGAQSVSIISGLLSSARSGGALQRVRGAL